MTYPYGYFQYWVHDFDNIFINAMKFYYKINIDGELIKRIVNTETSWSVPRLSFNQSTTLLSNGNIDIPSVTMVIDEGDSSYLRVVYDFENEKANTYYLNEETILPQYEMKVARTREMAKTGALTNLSYSQLGSREELYITSPIQDSIFYFRNQKLLDTFYAGDPAIQATDLEGYYTVMITKEINGGISVAPTQRSLHTFFVHSVVLTRK